MKSKTESASLEQKKRLAHWLEEWRVYQVLQHGLDADHSTVQPRLLLQEKSLWGLPIKTGQVRLLHPAVRADSRVRPVYVVVLKEGAGGWLIAPFSRFSEPATPGEWLTGLSAMPLRVLCLWNARVVRPDWLEKSWKAAALSKQKTDEALRLYRCIRQGESVPATFVKKVGSPVQHPLDPRFQYEMEERDFLFEYSTGEGIPAVEKKSGTFYDDAPAEKEYLKAAESRPSYGRRKRGKKA